ncbi:hypothetical protein J8136_12815 [Lactiplantibacillus plantarum]|uniref:hypothetical protein n=1 Tax=Lactiplantibacillus plantarum TaxID=1590 RepID=UPI001B320B40|nr:hypothetical protein [Lactiplantibacillus plantarum]MBP5818037.1 hypothetical protein [Lactiplantibacillus plantarum]
MSVKTRGRWLLGLMLGMGLWGPVTVHAATNLVRWPAVQSLAPRNCELESKQTRLYQLNRATMQLTPRGTARTTSHWQRVGQVMVTQNKRLVTYWQVRHGTAGRLSWALADTVRVVGTRVTDIKTPTRQPMRVVTTDQQEHGVTRAANKMSYLPLKGAGRYTTEHILFRPTAAYLATQGLQNQPDTLRQSSGYRDHYHFKTALYLPQQLGSRLLNDPQSATFSADNRYLYVMYVNDQQLGGADQTGWVVRYDWQRLMALGAGQAYYWTHASQLRNGNVTLYRGTISSTTGVHFEQLAQGLANNPGFFAQSIGYNEVTGRLYLVSDESITSLPAAKLGHLTTSQVGEANFAGDREFEGLVFMHHSQEGFLLTNRGIELMRIIVDK